MHRDNRIAPFLFVLLALIAVFPAASAKAASLDYVTSTLWSGVNDLACRDTLVYAAYQYGLEVINIADPASPKPVSQLYLPQGGFIGIAVQGNVAYLAAGSSGVAIVDISQPANPQLLAWRETPGSVSALVVDGDYLYVTDTWEGLQVINVTDPAHPFIEGSYDTPGDARGIARYGEYVLIADGYDGGLQVINVAIPEIPYPAGRFNTDGIAKRVAVEGHHAYVADADGGLVTFDMTDPTQPRKVSLFPEGTDHRYAEDVAVSGGLLYVVAGHMQAVDASDPDSLQLIDTVHEAGYCTRVVVSDGHLFAFYPLQGISILEMQSGSAPVVRGRYKLPGEVDRIAVQDSVLAVGCDDGMHLFDVSTPQDPAELSIVPALIDCYGVALSGSFAYIADTDSGTHVIDISNPAQPLEVNRLQTVISDREVSTNSGYLSVSGYDAGTSFYRLDDPVHPTLIGSYLASYLARAACNGHHGYIAAGFSGFQVINLVDSAAPFREGQLQIYGSFSDVVLDSPYAYLAHETAGLVVADISNPAQPREVGRFDGFPERPKSTGVAVSGGVAFLTADLLGVWAIDISNPIRPMPIAAISTPGQATRVAVSGDYVYVADLYGVIILKFNQPTDVTDGEPQSLPNSIQLAQNYPNPFNPRTTISFTLPERKDVRLVIYNLLGQEVIRLVDGVKSAGLHTVGWNGTDGAGRAVGSGVYLYRLSVGRVIVSRKMLLLK